MAFLTQAVLVYVVNPTVFIVDNDHGEAVALRELVESVRLRAEVFADAELFLRTHGPTRPGCIVLEQRLPGMSGLGLQKEFSALKCRLPIIFLTAHGSLTLASKAFRRGAFDFFEKPVNAESLLDRIKEAIQHDERIRKKEAERAEIRARIASLTPREREVLDRVVAGKHHKKIADELSLSPKTIDYHLTKVRRKMKAASAVTLVRMVLSLPET